MTEHGSQGTAKGKKNVHEPIEVKVLHGVDQDVDFVGICELGCHIADARLENFGIEHAHGDVGGSGRLWMGVGGVSPARGLLLSGMKFRRAERSID